MTNKKQRLDLLLSLAAISTTRVRLVNESSEDMTKDKVQIHCHGCLEYHDDEEFYVRIGEDPHGHGSNGVSFFPSNVLDIEKQPSGIWLIVLQG